MSQPIATHMETHAVTVDTHAVTEDTQVDTHSDIGHTHTHTRAQYPLTILNTSIVGMLANALS